MVAVQCLGIRLRRCFALVSVHLRLLRHDDGTEAGEGELHQDRRRDQGRPERRGVLHRRASRCGTHAHMTQHTHSLTPFPRPSTHARGERFSLLSQPFPRRNTARARTRTHTHIFSSITVSRHVAISASKVFSHLAHRYENQVDWGDIGLQCTF